MHLVDTDNHSSNRFTEGPPATVVGSAIMNAIMMELVNTIEGAGLTLKQSTNDTQDQLLAAVRALGSRSTVTVTTQAQLDAIIVRNAANDYEFDSTYTSVFVRYLSGGYRMNSYLSGGDTWGDLRTNNVTELIFENGATFDFQALRGHIEVDTDDCILKNVHVTGVKSDSAVVESFLLGANRVTFDNCKTSSRQKSAASSIAGFQGSGTALHNETSKYINCMVFDQDHATNTNYGFIGCYNLTNCVVYDMLVTSGTLVGFNTCYNLNSCSVYQLDATGGTITGYSACYNLSSCKAEDLTNTTGAVNGYNACRNIGGCHAKQFDSTSGAITGYGSGINISACFAWDFDSTTGDIKGYSQSEQLSACKVFDIAASGAATTVVGFDTCTNLSGCQANQLDTAGTNLYGFNACTQLSACKAEDLDSSGGIAWGFYSSRQISGCYTYDLATSANNNANGFGACYCISGCYANQIDATNVGGGDAYGFNTCSYISACESNDIDSVAGNAYGFATITYGAALFTGEAVNPACNWIDSTDAQIVNQESTPQVWT